MQSERTSALLVAFGDDRTDEEMFSALPREHISIHVGHGPSRAHFRLPDTSAVRDLLRQVAAEEAI